MVYCGRPSTSCNSCRAKKRRCDKVVPGCGQCLRIGQKCPGYRDPSTLVFRDESSQVIDRARSRVSKKSASSHPRLPAEAISPQAATGEMFGSGGDNDMLIEDGSHPELLGFDDVFGGKDALLPSQYDSFASMLTPGESTASPWAGFDADTGDNEGTEHSDGPCINEKSDNRYNANSSNEFSEQNTHLSSVPRTLCTPLDTVGLNFFLSNYVVRQSPPSSGFLDYTLDIFAREDNHEILEGAILALAFAGLARTTQQADLMSRSTMMYTRTMDQLNSALADPKASRRDSTIVAILILALYEFGKSSLEGWQHHVQGATSLLALRGKAQLTTRVGLQIFKDVFSHLLMECIRSGSPIPSNLRMLRIEAAKAIGVSDPYWVSNSAAVELLDLYQHFSPGGYNFNAGDIASTSSSSSAELFPSQPQAPKLQDIPMEDLELYLSQALDIDHRLESHFSKCPTEWQFAYMMKSSSSSQSSTHIHGDTYHIYHDVWVAHVWNRMRTCRILANHAISHLLLRGASIDRSWFFSNQYADRLQQVTKNMTRIREDMMASIPQQMGYVFSAAQQQQLLEGTTPVNYAAEMESVDAVLASSSSYSPVPTLRSEQLTYTGSAAGGYFASWVLVAIGCMHNLEDETRAWTVTQLRRINSQYGLAQADEFADSVEAFKLRPPLT